MSKKDGYKRLVTFFSALLLMGILTGIFAAVWYRNYSAAIALPFYRRGNWVLIGIYCLLIWLFFKVYGGFKLGYLKKTDMLYSQLISMCCVNTVTYFMISLIGRHFMDASPILLMTFTDFGAIALWTLLAGKIYFIIYPPRKLIIIYGSKQAANLVMKMSQRVDKYMICESVSADESEENVKELIMKYEGVIICDISGEQRNDYLKFKERCKGYADHGFKVMAVTPYPRDIISDMGFNPVDDIERTKEIGILRAIGASKHDVTKVISHPQALAQSNEYIMRRKFDTIEATNTAVAAKQVAETGDKSLAAIASAETAELYGLEVLDAQINTLSDNKTRFAAFSKSLNMPAPGKGNDKHFIVVFTVVNEAGSLAKTLNIIGANGFNMRNLRSRPIKGSDWSYYFFAELDGNVNSDEGRDLLRQLKTVCGSVKLVGSYTAL